MVKTWCKSISLVSRDPAYFNLTWLKIPYIAETSAMATKPTITPMITITTGSKSVVIRFRR